MSRSGFTLIELSIVLVIIGLVIGGILVGQDLITAAAVRAQVTQIEKYQTAVETFRGKYNGQLPGDMDSTDASQFGFLPGNGGAGQGDGNGFLQAWVCCGGNQNSTVTGYGENGVFWVHLSTAGLIDTAFNTATYAAYFPAQAQVPADVGMFYPAAKIGGGNYIYTWSGGYEFNYNTNPFYSQMGDGMNYFGLGAVVQAVNSGNTTPATNPGLTPAQAYAIDKKMDDGFPQSGKVLALGVGLPAPNLPITWAIANTWTYQGGGSWSPSNGNEGAYSAPSGYWGVHLPTTAATAWSSRNCYDNATASNANGVTGPEQYSLETVNGNTNATSLNCALSFQFQ